ncbi:uncharacterized protein N7498_002679 [Penicillium cinerascens]|uniref:Sulfotransferase family protein n=1 Tax=Penicillium cinerascens TaxID=70096 RepID=A0A9W9TB46_9EURO|nr:uncharacterized protein N7498_002679 [Penicillium cinerascens]KAJ5216272.1 hypothetical protein N7498_002679 [Penicillium cinerascens]
MAKPTDKEGLKILILGMPRTGTQSLADALAELGQGPIYHMRHVGENKHQQQWIAALEAKFEHHGPPFGRNEFEAFLGGFNGVADFPAAIFPDELIEAFPNAKVILTVRDEDKWFESLKATLWHAWSAPDAPRDTPMRPLADKYNLHMWQNDFPRYGREKYREHNAHVQEITPEGSLLVYNIKDGWEPICKFLGLDVPATPFPRNDHWLDYKRAHGTA